MSEIRIETEDLCLRTVSKEDINEVARTFEYPNEISLKKAEKAIKGMIKNHEKNKIGDIKHFCLAVCLKENPEKIIGWCGLDGEIEKDKVVLFYIITDEYRRKGYATQCAKALLKYAFETVRLDRVYGGCDKDNAPSYKIMSKIGMEQYSFDKNGNPQFVIDKEKYMCDNVSIKQYFELNRDKVEADIRNSSWVGGARLADMIKNNEFSEWETAFLAIADNQIVGFCTILKEDYYPENMYSPWISNVFVDDKYRGNRISERLIDFAARYAKEHGFDKVYIPTDIIGLYEKYGFTKIDELKNYEGNIDSIFMRKTE
ncbi:MAG: GNAT family N-acetyltransferase [Eubacterium sp.]|nr:GNAT family N-acetyltransferase [Eubacterium sp.]